MNIKWSKAEKQYISDNAATYTDKELARKLSQISGRTVTMYAVRKIRQRLGIKKQCGRGVCELDDDLDLV